MIKHTRNLYLFFVLTLVHIETLHTASKELFPNHLLIFVLDFLLTVLGNKVKKVSRLVQNVLKMWKDAHFNQYYLVAWFYTFHFFQSFRVFQGQCQRLYLKRFQGQCQRLSKKTIILSLDKYWVLTFDWLHCLEKEEYILRQIYWVSTFDYIRKKRRTFCMN